MKKNRKVFGVIGIVVGIIFVTAIAVAGWVFFGEQKGDETDTTTNANSRNDSEENGNANEVNGKKTSIYPNIYNSDGSSGTSNNIVFTANLPDGWSVQKVYEDYDIVKTISDDKFLIGSFIENDSASSTNRSVMGQRVAEGITTIATVETASGTTVKVLQTPTTVFLASCVPTGDNCYLKLNGKDLYIHMYQVVPGAQAASKIDYSSDSAQEAIDDFKSIAQSLSL